MSAQSVTALLDDIQFVNPPLHAIVQAVRQRVQQLFPHCGEVVKYGGILFTAEVQFAGVFAYQAHVSVEFGHGAQIADPFGLLEGQGKGRRHLKLRTLSDLDDKHLSEYLQLAQQAARLARA